MKKSSGTFAAMALTALVFAVCLIVPALMLDGGEEPGATTPAPTPASDLSAAERASLYAMQTPQAFRVELIHQAHDAARRDGFLGTDDASLLEHAGLPVYLCEGSRENLKLTTPTDLMLAGLILAARAEKELIG